MVRRVLKFGAPWCLPCTALGSMLDRLNLPYTSVVVDENPELANKHGVRGIPILVKVDEEGERVDSLTGLPSEFALKKFFSDVE